MMVGEQKLVVVLVWKYIFTLKFLLSFRDAKN